MTARVLLLASACALALGACAQETSPSSASGEEASRAKRGVPEVEPRAQEGDLDDLGPAPSFEMLERSGKPFSSRELEGKVWVAAFVFTRCPTHCVTICREMRTMQEMFADEEDFRLVCTTVDPVYDQPEVLRKFARSWDAEPDRWFFLWNRIDAVKAMMGEGGFGLGWGETAINHSPHMVVVDREGRIRGYYDSRDAGRVAKLRADVRTLLEGGEA